MHRLNRLTLLTLGILTAAYGSPGSAQPPDGASSAAAHTGGPAGIRRYSPLRWGIVAAESRNPTDRALESQALAYFVDDPTLQYVRRLWVPPHSVRRSWLPVKFPAFDPDDEIAELVSLHLDRSGRQEVVVENSSGEMRPSRLLAVTHSDTLTGVIGDRSNRGISSTEVGIVILAMKVSALMPCQLSELYGDFLPPTAESLDCLAHLVIAGDQLASDSAGLSAVRQWLIEGGRLWIMLDKVDPATVELLLGDVFDCEVVDRVGLTRVQLDLVTDGRTLAGSPAVEFEEPVELVRVITPNRSVVYSVNGWPAAFSRPVGNGRVLFTTLGPRGWLRDRTASDPEFDTVMYLAGNAANDPLAHVGATFLPRVETPLSSPERFSPALSRQIGYRIVGRNWIIGILGTFCLGLLIVGLLLRRGEKSERMVWMGPALATLTAGVLVVIGTRSQHEVPPTVAIAQIAHIESGMEEVRVTGVASIFNQDQYDGKIGATGGGVLLPDMAGLGGTTRRMVWTDLDTWHWENLTLPPGIRVARYETGVRSETGVRASGSFGPTGFSGTVIGGPFEGLSDAIIATPSHRNSAVRLGPDGGLFAGPGDILAAGHFINQTLLTDRQRRREAVYAEVFEPGGPVSYPTRMMLMAWADPLDLGFAMSQGSARVGWALLPIPLELEPVGADTEVVIPFTFIDFKQVAGPERNVATAYSNLRHEWLPRRASSRVWLRFQMPKETLPLALKRATFGLNISAPAWNVHICVLSDSRVIPLETFSGPTGAFEVLLDDPEALGLDQEGGLLIGIMVDHNDGVDSSSPVGGSPAGAPWQIESVQLDVSGVTLQPQD